MAGDDEPVRAPALLEVFGEAPVPADARVIPRPRSWRVSRALTSLTLAWGAAPVVFLIPPHAPWLIGALICGPYFARRYWLEHFTLHEMHGTCPRCAAAIRIVRALRLRFPHTLTCTNCHNVVLLEVDVSSLVVN
jgi:hypothetical protein